jgi:hypothetical protein
MVEYSPERLVSTVPIPRGSDNSGSEAQKNNDAQHPPPIRYKRYTPMFAITWEEIYPVQKGVVYRIGIPLNH